ncbi:tetratricopeptide repeat protein 29 [Aulostomus maculatus]
MRLLEKLLEEVMGGLLGLFREGTQLAEDESGREPQFPLLSIGAVVEESFTEFFHLLNSDRDRRAAGRPDVRFQAPLAERHDHLDTMKLHMSIAEEAQRRGSWLLVHEHRLLLGQFFSAPQDLWLRLHFLLSCTDPCPDPDSRPAAEARACLAELYLQQGELELARQQAELCVQLTDRGGWQDSLGQPLRLRARGTLWTIYCRLADDLAAAGAHQVAVKQLYEGYLVASESENKQMEGDAAYRLGLAYQSTGDPHMAKQFFSTCMLIYRTLQDANGLARTYRAMAKLSESNGLKHIRADACLSLGDIYYTRRQYTRACQYFLQGYDLAYSVGDVMQLQRAQVLVANARAHAFIRRYSADTVSATPSALQRLLAWKERGGGQERNPDSTHADDTAAWYR